MRTWVLHLATRSETPSLSSPLLWPASLLPSTARSLVLTHTSLKNPQTPLLFTVCVNTLFLLPVDSHGNEYDLSNLIRNGEDSPWIAIDTDVVKSRRFYINVCKPLPPVSDCPGQCARPRLFPQHIVISNNYILINKRFRLTWGFHIIIKKIITF